MLEVKINNFPSPLTLTGFTLFAWSTFHIRYCVTFPVWLFLCEGYLFVSGKWEMSCDEKPQQTNNPLPRHGPTECSYPHALISAISFCHWKHQPPFSLCSLAFNLAFTFFPLLWSTHPHHPSTNQYFFFFFQMALILPLCPFISWSVWLSSCSLLPSFFKPCTTATHIHTPTPPLPSPPCSLVRLVLFSPLDLNLGRWLESSKCCQRVLQAQVFDTWLLWGTAVE